MSKKKKGLIKCSCGNEWLPNEVPTNKEWNMVSPMPDAQGNVTITIMASWSCPKCGKSKTGAKGKTKGEFKEEDTPKYKLEQALNSKQKINLAELAKETGFQIENLKKIIPPYQKKTGIKGKVEGNFFIPE